MKYIKKLPSAKTEEAPPHVSKRKTPQQTKPSSVIKIRAVLASVKAGATIDAACKAADIERCTFYNWLSLSPKNREEYDKITDARTLTVEDALFKNVLAGNVTAQIFWLKSRSNRKWNDHNYDKLASDIAKSAVDTITFGG